MDKNKDKTDENSVLKTMDSPESYGEWLIMMDSRLSDVIKNLPLFFEVLARRVKKELLVNPALNPRNRFNEIVTDLGLEFVIR